MIPIRDPGAQAADRVLDRPLNIGRRREQQSLHQRRRHLRMQQDAEP